MGRQDIVRTPTLHEQLSDSPEDLSILVTFLNQRIIPDDLNELVALAHEAIDWITANLGEDYHWPGNILELEQCIRNVMIRGSYQPSTRATGTKELRGRAKLASLVATSQLDMKQLVQHYSSLAFATHGNYAAAADHLKINWRTVRDNMDSKLVEEYRE